MSYEIPNFYSKVVGRITQLVPDGMELKDLHQYVLIQLSMTPMDQLLTMCHESGATPYLHAAVSDILTPMIVQTVTDAIYVTNPAPIAINVETVDDEPIKVNKPTLLTVNVETVDDEPISKPVDDEPISKPVDDEPISKPVDDEPISKPVAALIVELVNDNSDAMSDTSIVSYASALKCNDSIWSKSKSNRYASNTRAPPNSPDTQKPSTWKSGVSRNPERRKTSTSAPYAFKKKGTEPVIPKADDHYAHFGKIVESDNGEKYELPIGWWYVKGMNWTYKINFSSKFMHTLREDHTWDHFEIINKTDDNGDMYEDHLQISSERMLWIVTPGSLRNGPCPV
jgi:hypothetical protein